MSISLDESNTWHGRPLYEAIVHVGTEAGLARETGHPEHESCAILAPEGQLRDCTLYIDERPVVESGGSSPATPYDGDARPRHRRRPSPLEAPGSTSPTPNPRC